MVVEPHHMVTEESFTPAAQRNIYRKNMGIQQKQPHNYPKLVGQPPKWRMNQERRNLWLVHQQYASNITNKEVPTRTAEKQTSERAGHRTCEPIMNHPAIHQFPCKNVCITA